LVPILVLTMQYRVPWMWIKLKTILPSPGSASDIGAPSAAIIRETKRANFIVMACILLSMTISLLQLTGENARYWNPFIEFEKVQDYKQLLQKGTL